MCQGIFPLMGMEGTKELMGITLVHFWLLYIMQAMPLLAHLVKDLFLHFFLLSLSCFFLFVLFWLVDWLGVFACLFCFVF